MNNMIKMISVFAFLIIDFNCESPLGKVAVMPAYALFIQSRTMRKDMNQRMERRMMFQLVLPLEKARGQQIIIQDILNIQEPLPTEHL